MEKVLQNGKKHLNNLLRSITYQKVIFYAGIPLRTSRT